MARVIPTASARSDERRGGPRLAALATRSRLVNQNATVFAGGVAAGVAGFAYHALAARRLGPAGYGELASLFALYTLGTVGYQVLLLVTARAAAHVAERRGRPAASALLRPLSARLLTPSVGACVVVLLIAVPVVGFLHMSSLLAMTLLGPAVAAAWLTAVPRGLLQGSQRFGLLSLSLAGEMALRVVGVGMAMAAGLWVAGAIGVLVVASAVTCVALWAVLLRDGAETEAAAPPRSGAFAGLAAASTVSMLWLYNADVFLARHFMSGDQAGVYASLNRVSTIVLMLTVSVGQVLFPRVVDAVARNVHPGRLLAVSTILVCGLGSAAVLVLTAEAPLVVRVLFGPGFGPAIKLVGWAALAGMVLSVVNLLTQFLMAVGDRMLVPLLTVGAAAEAALIAIWHSGPAAVVVDVLSVDAGLGCLLAVSALIVLRRPLQGPG